MCFSASASFTASAVLTTVGVASIRRVQEPSQLPFASIPLLFAVQQFCEGMLWIGLSDPAHASWQGIPALTFLIFAQVVWPMWVPWSILRLEKEVKKRQLLKVILVMGTMIAAYLAYCLASFDVHVAIVNRHISYVMDFPHTLSWLAAAFYFVPTVIPPFVSSVSRMRQLGIMIFVSYIMTTLFFHESLVSIWCFFAAILSAIVFLVLDALKKQSVALKLT